MMERVYLLLLVGAILMALSFFQFVSFHLVLGGMLVIIAGIQNMRTSRKELQYAQYCAVIALVINLILSVVIGRFLVIDLLIMLAALQLFFEISTFFWIFKAEYMWAPHRKKRLDLLIYSLSGGFYLLMRILVPYSILRFSVTMAINSLNFSGVLYYGVLIYISVKLYLEAKGNSGGLRRWN